jgi:predicted N-acetyltransferase YhbS
MVATEDGTMVGLGLFSPVSAEPEPPDEFRAVGLAPLWWCSPPANVEAQART